MRASTKREVKFYRLTGKVEMPERWDTWWRRGIYTRDFDISLKLERSGPMGGVPDVVVRYDFDIGYDTRFRDLFRASRSWCITSGQDYKTHSFLIWYMDRNRPLPPSAKLDPYRTKDYLRRESEGFPPPLFYTKLDIPER